MAHTKVAVTIDSVLLQKIDTWVAQGEFPNRSRVIQAGLQRLCEDREQHSTLLRELAKLDPAEEQALAEEWLQEEVPWTQS